MDFVVAGLGLGALVVVLGFVVRDLGPLLWRFVNRGRSSDSERGLHLWKSLCHSVSTMLTVAGAVILVATIVPVLLGMSDSIGNRIVIAISVVTLLIAGVLLAFGVREYNENSRELARTSPALSRQNGRLATTSVQTEAKTSALDPVRPARSPVEAPPAQPSVADESDAHEALVEEIDPHLHEPFDAARLLPSEFTEHDETVELAANIESAKEEEAVHNETGVAEDRPVDTFVDDVPVQQDEPVEEPTPQPADNIIRFPVPEQQIPEPAGTFQSPLLADISAPADQSESGFSSRLLADVGSDPELEGEEFKSPLLAGLARDAHGEGASMSNPVVEAIDLETDKSAEPKKISRSKR